MATIKISWVLPTTRVSGADLPVSEISHTFVEVSTDNGSTFTGLIQAPPDVLTTDVPDAEPGVWMFRASVEDTAGRIGATKTVAITVADLSPPGEVISLTLELV